MKLKIKQNLFATLIVTFLVGPAFSGFAVAASKQDKSAKRTALMIQKIKQDAELDKANMQAQFDLQKKKMEEEIASKDEQLLKAGKDLVNSERKVKKLDAEIAKASAEIVALESNQQKTLLQLESTQKHLDDMSAQYKKSQEDLKVNDSQRKTQSINLAETTKFLNACEIKNAKLHQFGTELIKIYDNPSNYEATMRKESFFQLKRVELENLLQEQQDKLDEEKVVSRRSVY